VSIATKTGDKGETSLMYGRRVPKEDLRVESYGSVDELNSALGLARAAAQSEFVREELLAVQKELITVMGELATSPEDLERYHSDNFPATSSAMVDRVTAVIDDIESHHTIKKGWVIPGASFGPACLDLARTACRRAERRVASLQHPNAEILRYLNRVSDLCWLLALSEGGAAQS